VSRAGAWLARAAAAVTAAALVFGAASTADAAKKKRKRKRAARAEPTAVPRPPDPNRVTFTTPDGVSLAATWRPVPNQPDAPAVLLVHDFSRDRRVLARVEDELLARGLASLAVDLRAHGESTHKGKTLLRLSPRLLADPHAFPLDVETACRWLRTRTRSVGVLGLSLGGNLAVLATANGWADAAVSVSVNAERLKTLAGTRPQSARGTLALSAENDAGRAASAQAITQEGREPKKLLLLPGAAHNLDLLDDPRAKKAAYDWLVERLGVVPPTPTPTPVFVSAESQGFGAPPTETPTAAPTPAPPTATPPQPAAAPTPDTSPFGGVVPPTPPPPTPRAAARQARRTSSAAREACQLQRGSRA
jgi:dienelactone hydrolase